MPTTLLVSVKANRSREVSRMVMADVPGRKENENLSLRTITLSVRPAPRESCDDDLRDRLIVTIATMVADGHGPQASYS